MGSVAHVADAMTLRRLGEIKHHELAVTIDASPGTQELIAAARGDSLV